MKKYFLVGLLFPLLCSSQVGVNTTTPQKTLHVNGSLQLVKELNVGGNSNTAGLAGSNGQILTSQGPNQAPVWKNLDISTASGFLSNSLYYQGTQSKIITEGNTSDVPGLSFSYTVPNTVTSQSLVMTFVGYARKTPTGGGSGQGVFSIKKNGVKISSAYVAVATGDGNSRPLVNLPIPCTMIKTIVLTPGTYNFVVNFSSWAGTLEVNTDPTEYAGYNNDTEAMLSKLNILVFNN